MWVFVRFVNQSSLFQNVVVERTVFSDKNGEKQGVVTGFSPVASVVTDRLKVVTPLSYMIRLHKNCLMMVEVLFL